MNPLPLRLPVLAAALLLAVSAFAQTPAPAGGASTTEIKRITDRYALTRTRINALLGQRLQPTALPANPANPFYQTPKEVAGLPDENALANPAESALVPEIADISDNDALRKHALALKIGGLITRNGVPHVTINNTTSTIGDIITVGSKDRPAYLKVLSLTPQEVVLGLNDSTLAVPLKK